MGALARMDEGRHRAELYRAWHVGQGAGFAPAVALEQIGPIASPAADEIRRYLTVGCQQGKTLSALVKARPKLFEPFEAAILAMGDEAGVLERSLRLLADHYARDYRCMLSIKSQLSYVVFAGVVASFVVTLPVLPRNGWRAYIVAVVAMLMALLFLGGLPVSLFAAIISTGTAFTLPRFARAMAIGVEAGLPLGRVVRLAVDISGSAELRQYIAKRTERELSSMKLAELFAGCRAVPAALLGQMAVADATGDYLHTLKRYADGIESP